MIRLKAPGRICLFGEHQDYLNLPVIAMAISKYIYLEAKRISEPKFLISLPDIDESMEFPLNNRELEYNSKRDYLKSGYNQFIRRGIKFSKGYNIKITGDIPINAGVASSSALVIVWLYFLNTIGGSPLENKNDLACEGYNTEVKEFGEAGGKMDFFSSAFGNIIYLDSSTPMPAVEKYNLGLDGFVLGDSKEKKDTVDDLIRTKNASLNGFKALKETYQDFNFFKSNLEEIEEFIPNLEKIHQKIVVGQIKNRDITREARNLISNYSTQNIQIKEEKMRFHRELGFLLSAHHKQLSNNINVSTKKIDTMLSECLNNGAFGGKINGSGFGGTMFAFTKSGHQNSLVEAIEETGGKAYIIKASKGVSLY